MAAEHRAGDLVVVIPTRDRWTILDQTLLALRSQSVAGFEVVVVVDGDDQSHPDLGDGVQVLRTPRGGPGAARNAGVRSTERPLVLFLGDDMVPTPQLVERHLDAHRRHPEPTSAVLGHVEWHADVPHDALHRWMDWSCTQFDYPNITGDDAGWGRFYSCNVSLGRSLFLAAGGFDEEFTFDYEDLDLAWRLHLEGLQLWYERGAAVHHLHPYDWDRMVGRYRSRARGERLMQRRHDWFEPYFTAIVEDAARHRRVSPLWTKAVDHVPARLAGLQRVARQRANRWYHQQVAPHFLAEWEGQVDLDDLRTYLGDDFDLSLLHGHASAVDEEEEAAPDEATFYRTSRMYLYDLTAFAMTGTKRPYLADLECFLPAGSSVLDYGCGIGSDGLRLAGRGYRVSFADFANPSAEYLRWRLERRGIAAPVYDLDRDEIPGDFRAAYSLDVIEHVEDPFAFLGELERRAELVMINLLEADPHDTHLHRPLPIGEILDHAASLGIMRYRRYHGRSHLVIYRTQRPGLRGRARNLAQRHLGTRLPTRI